MTANVSLPAIYQKYQAHEQENKDKSNTAIATSNTLNEIDEEINSATFTFEKLKLFDKWDACHALFEAQCQEYYDHSAKQFNFMEDQDPNNSEAYNAQLLKLGQGDLMVIDTDGNGEVSQEEYVKYELAEFGEGDETSTKLVLGTAAFVFNVMNNLFDGNPNNGLNANDFATLYKQFDNQTDGLNGEFSIDDRNSFLNYIISAVDGSDKFIEEYGEAWWKELQ